MRSAFIKTLADLAQDDPRIVLLTGDLGFMAIEPFSERFPQRFINVGVAEQNMVGIATGLAESGFLPFVYSIVTFATLRAYEFIRNGPILQQLPVRIVGIGGGFEYGTAGPTHYGLEDVGIMRLQPGLTVIAPADHQQTVTALRASWDRPGPTYYRLGKDDRTTVPGLDGRFELGHTTRIREGKDLLFITMGAEASEVAAAAEELAGRGLESTVVVVASVNPPPVDDLVDALAQFPVAITAEAHYLTGGVGSLVAEVIADARLGCRLVRCGVATVPSGFTGSQDYLLDRHGLSRSQLVQTALREVRRTAAVNA